VVGGMNQKVARAGQNFENLANNTTTTNDLLTGQ